MRYDTGYSYVNSLKEIRRWNCKKLADLCSMLIILDCMKFIIIVSLFFVFYRANAWDLRPSAFSLIDVDTLVSDTTAKKKIKGNINFDGQLSGVVNVSPKSSAWGLLNGRYLPEVSYTRKLDTTRSLYFEVSANIWGSSYFYEGDSVRVDAEIKPYRIFGRFSGSNYEVRLGLQKIDFGSAMILRPLQWFNEIDPRDPLAITDGVNAVLGRYYLKNNANLWVWGLISNENPRGYDLAQSNGEKPEYGGRFQYPVPRGELAISYHHRTADATNLIDDVYLKEIPENRIGLDGKWDVGVGLWFEAAYVNKSEQVGPFTHQTLATLGTDYTFPFGKGLGTTVEHMIIGYDEQSLGFENHFNTTALSLSYPIGFFDNLNVFCTYSWENDAASFFLNYQHDFRRITSYLMAFYTPETISSGLVGSGENDFVSSFSGPGLRLMLVYKH